MGLEMAYANLCLCENKFTGDMICNSHDCNHGNEIFLLLYFSWDFRITTHIKIYVGISGYHGYIHANADIGGIFFLKENNSSCHVSP